MVTGEEFAKTLNTNAQSHDLLQRLMILSDSPLRASKFAQSYTVPEQALAAGTETIGKAMTEAAVALITVPERMFFGNPRNTAVKTTDVDGLRQLIDSMAIASTVIGTAVYEQLIKVPNIAWDVDLATDEQTRMHGLIGSINNTRIYSESYRPQVLRSLPSENSVFCVMDAQKQSYWVSDVVYDSARNALYREYQLPGM